MDMAIRLTRYTVQRMDGNIHRSNLLNLKHCFIALDCNSLAALISGATAVQVELLQLSPPQKASFLLRRRALLSSWLSFEHCSIKMGHLNIEPQYSIQTLYRIYALKRFLSFHLNAFQDSVWSEAAPSRNYLRRGLYYCSVLRSTNKSGGSTKGVGRSTLFAPSLLIIIAN